MASNNKSLVELQKEIEDIGGKYYTDRIDLEKSSSEEINAVLNIFKNIEKIGEFAITEIDFKDGVKLMLGIDSKILVRPSGTEPLLRIYFESNSQEKLEKLKQAVEKMLI